MIVDGVIGLVALVLSLVMDRRGVTDEDCVIGAETLDSTDADDRDN